MTKLQVDHPRLSEGFYTRPTLQVARDLLGKQLVTFIDEIFTAGIIVETEAYIGAEDEAAHSFRGPTKRTEVMFQMGGMSYVYFIYGVHYCVNVVTEQAGVGAAVLIRALEPTIGTDHMRKRRRTESLRDLTSGPGKLCKAMGIDLGCLGEFFPSSKKIWIEDAPLVPSGDIVTSKRIGITKAVDLPWRFYINKNLWVSGRAGAKRT
jgi:DNA-3-methyladenine glycosylase